MPFITGIHYFTEYWFMSIAIILHSNGSLDNDFDLHIEYIKGEYNTLADYLSRNAPVDADEPSDPSLDQQLVALHALTTYQLTLAPDLLCVIAQGYQGDVLFKEWLADPSTAPGVTVQEHDSYQLLLVDNRLCIPDTDNLHENLMRQAHEGTAAHLGLEKTLEVLRNRYFWDTMSKDTPYKVGDWVWLDTRNRLKEFWAGDGEFRAAKFFPHFQGSYQVQEANPTLSVYHLYMNDKTYPKFHGHLLKPYLASPCFHQTSPLIPTPHSNSSPPSNSQQRCILQILDDRHHQGH
ncbi:hypothetical protein D1P53_006033 [Cryptococcus gattii VGV]|nr:hypothetical protein D1P53_006033 [Cryptococcus gattii VGV]